MEVILKRLSTFISAAVIVMILFSGLSGCGKEAERNSIPFSQEAVSKHTLDNGLVLLTKEIPSQKLAAVNVTVNTGSALEGDYLGSGISHLVEHMLFKGTATRGPGEIEKEIKAYGGFINGSAGQDLTDYTVTIPAQNLPRVFAILKDMLLNAAFNEEELAKEKEVLLKEMNMGDDDPQSLLLRTLYDTAYIRHSYKYPPIGYEERFRAIKRDDLVRYYNSMYSPNRIAISVVGGINTADIISMVRSEFGNFRPSNYAAAGLSPEEPQQIDERRAEKKIETNLAYLALGYHSTGVLDEDLFAMDVLSMILGRGDESRLNKKLVKEDRVLYSVSCWNATPRDPGMFIITAMTAPEKSHRPHK